MKFIKVFVDGNVIIDLFDSERKNHRASTQAIQRLLSEGSYLLTSSDLITTVYYVLSGIDREKALRDIEKVIGILDIIPFGRGEVAKAIEIMKKDKNFRDLEDTLLYVLAKKENCNLILSNDRDFYSPDLRVMSSGEFCETYCN